MELPIYAPLLSAVFKPDIRVHCKDIVRLRGKAQYKHPVLLK